MSKDKIIKIKKNVKYSICSCGKSDKLPYCDNNHRKYGVYYCSENHIIKSKDIKNITINITDISETIHSNIDTLNIYKLEINEKHIILHGRST